MELCSVMQKHKWCLVPCNWGNLKSKGSLKKLSTPNTDSIHIQNERAMEVLIVSEQAFYLKLLLLPILFFLFFNYYSIYIFFEDIIIVHI